MADFRKVYVLAAVVLLLGLASTASAQVGPGTFSCTANAAVPPLLRAEGLTELVGDIVVDCIGGVPTAAGLSIPQANFQIFLNTTVTSRTYDLTNVSEALLIVDEPGIPTNINSPLLGCNSNTGCLVAGTGVGNLAGYEPYCGGGAGCPAAPAGTTRANVFRCIVSGNSVQFIGVPVDPPGTAGHRIFRMTNVRANASGISAGPSGTPGTIQALISVSGSTSVPVSNPTQVVGYVQQGMTFNLRRRDFATANSTTDIQFPQCNSLSRTTTTNSFVLQYAENFPTSFKLRQSTAVTSPATLGDQNVPGNIFNTESGFYQINKSAGIPAVSNTGVVGGNLPANVGLADAGTRVKAVFANLPAGTSVYVSVNVIPGVATVPGSQPAAGVAAQLVASEVGALQPAAIYPYPSGTRDFLCGSSGGVSGICAANAVFPGDVAQIPVIGGIATAVWEITGANALSSDAYAFAVWFSYSANAAQNSPPPGTGTVTGGFAPTPTGLGVSTSTAAAANISLQIPRFIEGTQTKSTFSIYVCRTTLLFPFVTNQYGFDTGLAISNTSSDPFGTSAQAGTCTLFSYGANAPASQPTPNIPAGTAWSNSASVIMPNFQGYVIAQCGFQFAHGFAFVSDLGARNLAMGYLALVIPEPGLGSRGANPPGAQTTSGSGEGLGL